MIRKLISAIFLIAIFVSPACQKKEKLEFEEVLQFSLEYLIENHKISDVYSKGNLKIIKPQRLSISPNFRVNGSKSIILPDTTNVDRLLVHMQVYDPILLVEVISFNSAPDSAKINVRFRGTGQDVSLQIRRLHSSELEVVSIVVDTI